MIKLFEDFEQNLSTKLKPHLVDGKYLYHFTFTGNLQYSILEEGLIPRKYPNSYYSNVQKGVYLTSSYTTYKANLPQNLIDELDEYYDNEDEYDTKPVVRLKIDVSELDVDKFTWDDDYILNAYGWNKASTKVDKIIESLSLWQAIVYLGHINKSLIVDYGYDY